MIAIDFGTSNSSVAVFAEGDTEPRLQKIGFGDADSIFHEVVPSVVSQCGNHECRSRATTFGHEALRHYYGSDHDISLLQEMKLHFDVSTQTTPVLAEIPGEMILRQEGGYFTGTRKIIKQAIYEGNVPLKPSEFVPGTAELIQYLVRNSKSTTTDRRDAVFGVPASFKDAGKRRLREAAKRALGGGTDGYEGIRVYYEPHAAARAYMDIHAGNTLVLDYGGGTLDISVMAIEKDGRFDPAKVSYGGFSEGGSRIDEKVLEYCLDLSGDVLSDWYVRQNMLVKRRIKRNVEKAKIELSSATETTVDFTGSPIEPIKLTLAHLTQALQGITMRMAVKITEVVMNGVGKIDNIDFVILSGGTSLSKVIQDAVVSIFRHIPQERFILPDASNQKDVETCLCAVAKGLALLRGDNVRPVDFGD